MGVQDFAFVMCSLEEKLIGFSVVLFEFGTKSSSTSFFLIGLVSWLVAFIVSF
jgi:hypothetical protein